MEMKDAKEVTTEVRNQPTDITSDSQLSTVIDFHKDSSNNPDTQDHKTYMA